MYRMLHPSSARRLRVSNSLEMAWGVRTEVGSSMISSLGDCIRQRTISTRWRSPTDMPTKVAAALAAPDTAAAECLKRYGALDVKWGDVYRFRSGKADLPGNGDSTPLPMSSPTIADYAAALLPLIDAESAPVDLYGFHAGASVAMELALARPAKVRRVVLDSLGLYDKAETEEMLRELVRLNDLQLDEKYFEMVQLSDWITKMQPHFVAVWVHQAWNLSYNISVKFKDYSDRWNWVQRGIALLRDDGLRYNPNEMLLYRELAGFFQHLDRTLGLRNVAIVLTADHGFMNVPEYTAAYGMGGERLNSLKLMGALNEHLTARYGPGNHALRFSYPTIILDQALITKKGLNPADVETAAAHHLMKDPSIAAVYTRTQLETGALSDSMPLSKQVLRAWNRDLSGDLYIVQNPNGVFTSNVATHGSPYTYDTNVPLVFYGPRWFKPGKKPQAAAVVDVAATLSYLLDIRPPTANEGRVLEEILR